ncbi:MAG: hypothetical protein FJ135_16435 [Deltaproteobacteria bacterium]|nr:hypothetical protein [Deltaproteobacteria bacterium]
MEDSGFKGRHAWIFLEPDGQPVSEQLQHLETVRKAPRRLIYGLIQRLQGQPAPAVTASPPSETPDTGPPPWEEKLAAPRTDRLGGIWPAGASRSLTCPA